MARYSLQKFLLQKFALYSCEICSLFVAEVASCQNSLVIRRKICLFTRCRIFSLQKLNCYSLQKFPIIKLHSLLSAKIARYSLQKFLIPKITHYPLWNSFVTRCQLPSLLATEYQVITRCKICLLPNAEVSRCKNSLFPSCRSCSLQKLTRCSLLNLVS